MNGNQQKSLNPSMKFPIELSFVVPVFNEEKNVSPFIDELVSVLENLKVSYEILLINVPGHDLSFPVVAELGKKYEHVYPINMYYLQTRSYQKAYQYMLGFRHSKGSYVIQMDSDYQDDPKDLPKFLEKLAEGYEVVVGWKQDRKDPFFYKLTSKMQNSVTRLVTGVQVHDKNCGYKAYSRRAVESVNLYGMNYRDIPMQLAAKGFKITEVPIANRHRISGKSNFTFFNRLLGGTLDFLSALFVTLMLDKPFRIWGGLGIVSTLLGICVIGFALIWSILTHTGGLSLSMLMCFMIGAIGCVKGIVLFSLGVMAEYQRSLRPFSMTEYAILDDPKGRLSQED